MKTKYACFGLICLFWRQSDKVNGNFKYKNLQVGGGKEKEPMWPPKLNF